MLSVLKSVIIKVVIAEFFSVFLHGRQKSFTTWSNGSLLCPPAALKCPPPEKYFAKCIDVKIAFASGMNIYVLPPVDDNGREPDAFNAER